jgi:uncharacterized protein YjiS (DUF1127 family)
MSTLPSNDTTTEPRRALLSTRSAGIDLVTRMQGVLAGLRGVHAERRAEARLMALDDRMLKDIGLVRGAIGSTLRHAPRDRRKDSDPKR